MSVRISRLLTDFMQLCIVDSILQDLGIARVHSRLQFFGSLLRRMLPMSSFLLSMILRRWMDGVWLIRSTFWSFQAMHKNAQAFPTGLDIY